MVGAKGCRSGLLIEPRPTPGGPKVFCMKLEML